MTSIEDLVEYRYLNLYKTHYRKNNLISYWEIISETMKTTTRKILVVSWDYKYTSIKIFKK